MRLAPAVILAAIFLAGCTIPDFGQQGGESGPQTSCTGTIKIATFNIQTFGQSKLEKPGVADWIAQTIRKYDVVAVEEVRDSSGEALPALMTLINAAEPRYEYAVSPRLGSSSSKEQYAFIYNTETVAISGEGRVFNESIFERPPFAARFTAGNFDFVLVAIHTKPKKNHTIREIDALADVAASARTAFGDQDIIVLGDYNADCSYVSAAELAASPLRNASFFWVVGDDVDTTVRSSTNCSYDRIVMTNAAKVDYSGSWGVQRFDEEFASESAALEVSDHYPVWAEFRTC